MIDGRISQTFSPTPSGDDKESESVVTVNFQAELRSSKDGYLIDEDSSPHLSDDRILANDSKSPSITQGAVRFSFEYLIARISSAQFVAAMMNILRSIQYEHHLLL
jgi:hypothetical protein